MIESHIDLFHAVMAHRMNMLYLLVSICVIYKLAWVGRQVSNVPGKASTLVRITGGLVGTVILLKAMWRFEANDPAEWLDILRELLWCCFLFSSIVWLRTKTGHW